MDNGHWKLVWQQKPSFWSASDAVLADAGKITNIDARARPAPAALELSIFPSCPPAIFRLSKEISYLRIS